MSSVKLTPSTLHARLDKYLEYVNYKYSSEMAEIDAKTDREEYLESIQHFSWFMRKFLYAPTDLQEWIRDKKSTYRYYKDRALEKIVCLRMMANSTEDGYVTISDDYDFILDNRWAG